MDCIVSEIKWERSNLILVLNKQINKAFLAKKEKSIPLNTNKNIIVISIINLNETVLDKGTWHIEINNNPVGVNPNLLANFDQLSKVFYYRNKFYSYNVDFLCKNNIFYIDIHFMMENRKYKKYLRLCEGKSVLAKGKIFSKIILIKFLNIIYLIGLIFKSKRRKTILFLTENSNQLTENLQIIYKNLKNKSYKLITFCHNDFNTKYNLSYIKEAFLLAKSDIVLLENYTPILNFINIKKKTKIIQLWHAGVGFKAVGYARFGKKGSPHPYYSSHRKYDYVIVDNESLVDIYQEVFGIRKDKIMPYGMPRLDNFLNKENILKITNELYEMNSNLKEKKVILFAPTYRGENQSEAFYDFEQLDFEKIYQFCQKNNFVFVIKKHPFIKEQVKIDVKYADLIIDYSNININNLMYVADILITDYSSCAYEFSILKRPIIFFRYDKNQYEYERPLHGDLSRKGIEVTNFNDLLINLEKLKNSKINKNFNNIDYKQRNSIKRIVELIEKELDNNENNYD